MSPPIRIGLLGASRIARGAIMAPARDDPRFQVTAVGARDPGRAAAYAELHGIPAVADGYAELVRREDVDVVYNALPPAGHAEWTIAALEAGKTVLCEKPFALNAAEAKAMVAAAEAAGQVLLEAFHYRFHNVMRRAEALLASGVLGPLVSGAATFEVSLPPKPGEIRWSPEQGGGSLMDLGCYCVHALRTLFRAEPTVAGARARFELGVDASLSADLLFPGGRPATLACSLAPPAFAAPLRIVGERGRLDISNFVFPQRDCRLTTTIDGLTTDHATDGRTTYEAQLDHLFEVMTGAAAPLTGGADAIGNMAAIEAIYRVARG